MKNTKTFLSASVALATLLFVSVNVSASQNAQAERAKFFTAFKARVPFNLFKDMLESKIDKLPTTHSHNEQTDIIQFAFDYAWKNNLSLHQAANEVARQIWNKINIGNQNSRSPKERLDTLKSIQSSVDSYFDTWMKQRQKYSE